MARLQPFEPTNDELKLIVYTPVWQKFIAYCEEIGHGEIEKLKIQDGVPVLAEKVTQKTRFA